MDGERAPCRARRRDRSGRAPGAALLAGAAAPPRRETSLGVGRRSDRRRAPRAPLDSSRGDRDGGLRSRHRRPLQERLPDLHRGESPPPRGGAPRRERRRRLRRLGEGGSSSREGHGVLKRRRVSKTDA